MATSDLPRTLNVIHHGIEQRLHLGAQVYVSLRGESLVDCAVGEARSGVPLRRDDLMLWMSSCKPITAVAIAQLWEQGRLSPDDFVARHIPEFAANGKDRITIRHVLTHTAGFPKAAYSWSATPWDEVIAGICAAPLEPGWIPGRDAGYHVASAWYTLAEIVRRIDGRPYPQYVREAIFAPLGIKDSWIGGMPPERHREYGDRIVPMHSGALAGSAPQPFGADFQPPYRFWSGAQEACGICRPGGSAWGPARELGRFYESMLAGGGGLIRPQTVEAITARHTVGKMDRTFGFPLDRGLGVVVDSKRYGEASAWYGTRCSERAYGHQGAWSSVAFADPECGLAVAIVFNGMTVTAPKKHDERVIATLDALYDELGL